MLLGQMPGDGVRPGIQPLPGQVTAQPHDQFGGGRRDRGRLVVRPPGSRFERGLTLAR